MKQFLFQKDKAQRIPEEYKVFILNKEPNTLVIRTMLDVTTKEWGKIKKLPGYRGVYFG